MSRRWIIGCVCLLLSFELAWAQRISVTAKTSENTIGLSETLVYTVEVKAVGGQVPNVYPPQPPQAQGLDLIQSNPSVSESTLIANGRAEQSRAFSWYYKPLREGDATLGRTAVVIGKETFSTSPITVRIVPQNKRPQSPSFRSRNLFADPFADDPNNSVQAPKPPPPGSFGKSDVFIKVFPSTTSVYQGEQMFVDYFLYVKRGIELRNSRLSDSWDAAGFWREELKSEGVTEIETLNGEPYRKILIKKIAIFPTRSGQLTIDPLKVQADASKINYDDPFSSFFGNDPGVSSSITIESPSVTINARPLPDGPPKSFQGMVGRLSMLAQLDKTSTEVGSPVTIQLAITGSGNLSTMQPPTLEVPPVVEKYDPEVSEQIDKSVQVYGTKTYKFTLIPRENGKHVIPPIEFTYFDLETKQYKTLRSAPFTFTATGEAQSISNTRIGFPANDIAPILTQATWLAASGTPLHQQVLPILALILPLLGLGGLFFYRQHLDRLNADVAFARERQAQPLAQKHLKTAGNLLSKGEPKAFYDEISKALMGFIGNRFNLAEKGLTLHQLEVFLMEQGLPIDLRETLMRLLQEAEAVRFAPVKPDIATMQTAYQKAAQFITDLDKTFKQRA